MNTLLKMAAARKVVRTLGAVTQSSQVLVVCDPLTAHNTDALLHAVDEVGASWTRLEMPVSAGHGAEPPGSVAAAMLVSDLVIAITATNLTHTNARKKAQAAGTRVIVLPESDGDDFFLLPGWNVDFWDMKPKIEALANRLTEAKVARVVTKSGTDISMSLEGRRGRALTGFAGTEDVSAGYGLEASIAPVEQTANGVIMVDESVPGVLQVTGEPICINVVDGYAREIWGSSEADRLHQFLSSFNDPEVFNLAELGFGMNPCCVPDGRMLSDENVLGHVQLALGTSAYIGGQIRAAAHYDTIVTGASVELDGVTVLEGKEILV